MKISIQKLSDGKDLPLPKYATVGSAGMDLMAAIDVDIILPVGERIVIPCGIAMALPVGYEAQIRPRSGLALKHGVTCLNAPGTIDSDYRGEIKVILINHGQEDFTITPAMRIAQMVIAKYESAKWELVEELTETERQDSGFGSTGTD